MIECWWRWVEIPPEITCEIILKRAVIRKVKLIGRENFRKDFTRSSVWIVENKLFRLSYIYHRHGQLSVATVYLIRTFSSPIIRLSRNLTFQVHSTWNGAISNISNGASPKRGNRSTLLMIKLGALGRDEKKSSPLNQSAVRNEILSLSKTFHSAFRLKNFITRIAKRYHDLKQTWKPLMETT